MDELKLKTETLATRCDICHQSDLFEQSTGRCLRCDNLKKDLSSVFDRIEFSYDYTPKDSMSFQIYALPRNFSVQLLYVGLFILIFFFSYITLMELPPFFRLIVSFISAVICFSPMIVIFPIFLYINAKSKKNKTKYTNHKVTVTDKCIIEETEYKREQYNWNCIQKVSQSKNYLYVYDTNDSAIVIPKRCFKDKLEETNVINFIYQHWKK